MLEFLNPLFDGLLGEVMAWGLTFVGASEILTAMLMHRKKAYGNDKAVAKRYKPVFWVVLFSGFLITCIGLHGLDLHYGANL
ncbi:MAG: hypothetical protein MK052_11170 [Alphaproteobacteria bacterium]|nr:hypothetical protein [Alphaproteobacteria bacterium]